MKKNILLTLQVIFIICINIKTVCANVTLNYKELNIGINVTQQLKVTGKVSNYLSWNSSNKNVASVKDGYITGLSLGTTFITIVNGQYSDSCKVNVISDYKAVNRIELPSTSGELLIDETKNINASLSPSDASNKMMFYSSSNPSIVSVDKKGNITGKKIGTAIITIIAENKSNSYKVDVVDKIPLKGISISSTKMTLTEGNSAKLSIAFTPNNATDKSINWKSSNPVVVSVDTSGNIKALSPGTAIITATSKDGEFKANSQITVNTLDKKLKGISLNKTDLTLKVNETASLFVNYNPVYADKKDVDWSSSNSNIATVDNGKITAIKPGITEIKVISKEGNYEAVCKITVLSPPIENIKFENNKQTVYIGSITELKAILTPENAMTNDLLWTSSDEKIATIDNGKLSALEIGTSTITVSDKDGKISASTEITVIDKPEESLMITISGYDLKFDKSVKNYTLEIGSESSLDIKVNRDKEKVIIGGNRDLQNGSIITITINEKKKTTYVINIKKNNNHYLYFIVAITILLLINIIRIIIKNKKKNTMFTK